MTTSGNTRQDGLQELAGRGPREPQEIAPDIWLLPGFGNATLVLTDEGIAVVDPGLMGNGPRVLREVRERSQAPIRFIIYTHGHADHAFGTGPLLVDASERGDAPPQIVAHELALDRLARYQRLRGQHEHINRIQFAVPPGRRVFPDEYYPPTLTYHDRLALTLGGLTLECRHGMGETDDATWVWIPERSTVIAGDFLVSCCPNVGNPFKVQRFALEWAEALEEMAGLEPQHVIPGHGPLADREQGQEVMLDTARALRHLEDEVVRRLNAGQWHEQILEEVDLPDDLKEKPYLQPIYGCPRFVVHGILRRYSGWHDGNAGNLLPSTRAEIGEEVLHAAGGASPLLERARALREAGGLRNVQRALHLVDFVLFGEGEEATHSKEAHALKADLLEARAEAEPSFIARNIFRNAAQRDREAAG
jgi:alkyl sulfatase BDS1-like metallo-beta-lactamase superfamily hydrolase